ncbi:hypothetical protein GW932_05145 [archaeon]|nr:hypothetical protein [archaeon]
MNNEQNINEPFISEGFIRLYRSEDDSKNDKPAPEWVKESSEYKESEKAKGRWFYKNLEDAKIHASKFGSRGISYLDVPLNELEKYNAKNNKFAGGYGKEGNEYFLPKEMANNRIIIEVTKKVVSQKRNILESKLFSGFFTIAFFAGLIFGANQLTGNVIGIENSTSNIYWPILSFIGILGFYVIRKYKN